MLVRTSCRPAGLPRPSRTSIISCTVERGEGAYDMRKTKYRWHIRTRFFLFFSSWKKCQQYPQTFTVAVLKIRVKNVERSLLNRPDVKICLYFSFKPGVRSGCGQRYRRLCWTFTIPSAVILPKKSRIKLVAEAGKSLPVEDFQSKTGSTCSVVFFQFILRRRLKLALKKTEDTMKRFFFSTTKGIHSLLIYSNDLNIYTQTIRDFTVMRLALQRPIKYK